MNSDIAVFLYDHRAARGGAAIVEAAFGIVVQAVAPGAVHLSGADRRGLGRGFAPEGTGREPGIDGREIAGFEPGDGGRCEGEDEGYGNPAVAAAIGNETGDGEQQQERHQEGGAAAHGVVDGIGVAQAFGHGDGEHPRDDGDKSKDQNGTGQPAGGEGGTSDGEADQEGEQRKQRQEIAGEFVGGGAEEDEPPNDGEERELRFGGGIKITAQQQGQREAPGEEQREEIGEVKPDGLAMLQGGGGETAELVLEEEHVDEGHAVAQPAEQIPGDGDQAEGGEHSGAQKVAQLFAGDPEQREREHEGHETFGEYGETETRGGGGQEAAIARAQPGEGEQKGGGEGGGERQVGDGDLAEGDPAGAGGENHDGVESRARAEGKAEPPVEENQEQRAENGNGQAGGEVGAEAGEGAEGGHPIEERGLFEPGRAPEAGGDPVTGAGHLAADGGVARFVRPEHAEGGEVVETEDEQRDGETRTDREGCATAWHLFIIRSPVMNHYRVAGVLAVCAVLGGCARPEAMELWYWHHSYLVSPEAVRASKALIDRAARAGYTGMALWDSSLIFMSSPEWPERNRGYLREVIEYAQGRGLRVMPLAAPYGRSNDMLITNPNWAEGQRVIGTMFRVDAAGTRLEQVKSASEEVTTGPRQGVRMRLNVIPWRQYHLRVFCRTSGFHGQAQVEVFDGKKTRMDAGLHPPPDQDWTPLDYTFNSADSTTLQFAAGAFGAANGELWMDRFFIEETALVYVLRRAGTPLRVYDTGDPSIVFAEGKDFDPVHDAKLLRDPRFEKDNYHDPGAVTLPAGSRLRPGQLVAMDYYAVAPFYDDAVGACLTDAAVERWVRENAREVAGLVRAGSGLLLSHDEMRHLNSCAQCRAKGMTAGQLLAWSFQRTAAALQPFGPLYVWSDMFDPYHNAHAHYAFAEGTLAGSWEGLPAEVTLMNWNLDRLTPSLTWFSGDDPRQPVAHRQVIAGYYDTADHDGAAAARREMAHATGIPGVAGMMYTTWRDDYSELESYARGAREAWESYRRTRPPQWGMMLRYGRGRP